MRALIPKQAQAVVEIMDHKYAHEVVVDGKLAGCRGGRGANGTILLAADLGRAREYTGCARFTSRVIVALVMTQGLSLS